MKILYVITGLGVGGAERIVCDLADQMEKLGHIVEIVCLTGKALTIPKNKNIKIHFLNLDSIFDILKSYKNLNEIIINSKADIVHAHMFHAILLVRLSKLFYNKTVIISHAHNTSYGSYIRALAYRSTNFLSDLNVNVSFEATNNFIKNKIFNKKNTLTVLNGIDVENYKKNILIRNEMRNSFSHSDEDFILINVASLTEQKDHINLINAYCYILNKGIPQSHLYIVGEGPLRNLLELEINKLNMSDKITLLGIRKDIDKLLNMSDLFILSSAWEGLPLVVAEAMATEKIVVSTNCGGVKEIINNNEMLVNIKNPVELGDKILDIISLSSNEKDKIAYENRQKVKEFYSLNSMAENWNNIYMERRK